MATRTPGRLPGYETTIITRSEISEEALKNLQDRLAGVIRGFSGEVVMSEDWGKRKLAYPISKENRAQYNYIVYTGKGDVVQELERNLRLQDNVLRFLTVNLDKEFDADAFTKRRQELAAAAKRREEEREARREERMREGREERGYRGDREDRGYRAERKSEPSESAGSEE